MKTTTKQATGIVGDSGNTNTVNTVKNTAITTTRPAININENRGSSPSSHAFKPSPSNTPHAVDSKAQSPTLYSNRGDTIHAGNAGQTKFRSTPSPTPVPSTVLEGMDGGWGWVVVASSVFVSAVVDGVGYSVGIFYSTFMETFEASQEQTSLVTSLLQGTALIIGPIAGMCVNQYGCRKTAIFGALLSTVAFLSATFSHNINILIITFGFLAGAGFGFLYTPSMVIVGYYFHRRRALALGITCCGSGLGALAFAPLLAVVKDTHGWKPATYVIVGLTLICTLTCAAYRPVASMQVAGRGVADVGAGVRKRRKLTTLEMSVLVAVSSVSSVRLEEELLEDESEVDSSLPSATSLRTRDLHGSKVYDATTAASTVSAKPPNFVLQRTSTQQPKSFSETEVMRLARCSPEQREQILEAFSFGNAEPRVSVPHGNLTDETSEIEVTETQKLSEGMTVSNTFSQTMAETNKMSQTMAEAHKISKGMTETYKMSQTMAETNTISQETSSHMKGVVESDGCEMFSVDAAACTTIRGNFQTVDRPPLPSGERFSAPQCSISAFTNSKSHDRNLNAPSAPSMTPECRDLRKAVLTSEATNHNDRYKTSTVKFKWAKVSLSNSTE